MSEGGRIPVTILTGFLGAGKTTLLNYILKENHGRKIAVIENEFGEIGIDDALVIACDEEVFEMNNGCICCTVRGDLIRILGSLAKRRNKFDYVLVETTGLADPGPIAQTFFVDEDVKQNFQLDGIVTVVDCRHVLQHLFEVKPEGVENESEEQIAFADRVLLNKVDLVSEEELKTVENNVRRRNANALIKSSQFSRVPLDFLMGIGAFKLEQVLAMDPQFLEDADHQHDLSVTSVGLSSDEPLDGERFNAWIGNLLQTRGVDLFRSKGVLHIAGCDRRLVFQGVHMLIDSNLDREWLPNESKTSRVVFIGRNLNRAELEAGFASIRA